MMMGFDEVFILFSELGKNIFFYVFAFLIYKIPTLLVTLNL